MKKVLIIILVMMSMLIISCKSNNETTTSMVTLKSIEGSGITDTSSIVPVSARRNKVKRINNSIISYENEQFDLETNDDYEYSYIESAPQTVVLFDDNKYAEITIKLENPYEYYICDFIMTYTDPNAQIYVDDEWIPLDGSVKIRWTGSTNRKAKYNVYLPTFSDESKIIIKEMKYLNEKEIMVDLNNHEVADVYSMEQPLKDEFVVNTTSGYIFSITKSSNCTIDSITGAEYDKEKNVYKTNDAYKIDYSFTLPNRDIVLKGNIEKKITPLYVTCGINRDLNDYDVQIYDSTHADWMGLSSGFHGVRIHNFRISGTGFITFKGNANWPKYYYESQNYFTDFSASIDDGPICKCLYLTQPNGGWTEYGFLYINGATAKNVHYYDEYSSNAHVLSCNIKLYWNGYLVWEENLYNPFY